MREDYKVLAEVWWWIWAFAPEDWRDFWEYMNEMFGRVEDQDD